jgi:hypothetical protein
METNVRCPSRAGSARATSGVEARYLGGMRHISLVVVAVSGALSVHALSACEASLNEKHVWVSAAHGFEGGAGALVDGPIVDAATAFARRNGLAVTSSATPCTEAGCDLAAAREAGAGTVLVADAQAGGLELKLLDSASGNEVAQERAADASTAGPAVDRLLYARYGGTSAAGASPTVTRPVEPPPDTAPALVPVEQADARDDGAGKKSSGGGGGGGKREASSTKIVGKAKPGVELRRGDANGGTLILMTDALHWKPPNVNIAGTRAQKFALGDIKRINVEKNQLVVTVSWGPKYTFDTKDNEMSWRNAIDDARSTWTGQPKDN